MKMAKIYFTTVFVFLLSGCGAGNDDPDVNKKNEPQGVIPKEQLRALEQAKNVGNLLLDAEEKRKKAMEKQGL